MNKKSAARFALLCALASMTLLPILPPARAFQDKPVLTDAQKKLVTDARDAARSADRTVVTAEETRRSADGKVTVISGLIVFDTADDTAMRELEELADTLGSISRLSLLTALDDRNSDLTKARGEVTKARDALPAEATGEAEEFSSARKESNAVIDRIDKQVTADTTSKKKLIDVLASIRSKVKTLAELFPSRLAVISAVAKDAKADALIPLLPEQFPDFIEVERLRRVLRLRWKEVRTALESAGSTNADGNTAVLKAIDDVDTQTVGILQNMKPWMDTLTAFAQVETSKTSGLVPKLISNPVMNSPEATAVVGSSSDLHANLSRLGADWITLSVQLRGQTIPGFDSPKTAQSAQALEPLAKLGD